MLRPAAARGRSRRTESCPKKVNCQPLSACNFIILHCDKINVAGYGVMCLLGHSGRRVGGLVCIFMYNINITNWMNGQKGKRKIKKEASERVCECRI